MQVKVIFDKGVGSDGETVIFVSIVAFTLEFIKFSTKSLLFKK